MPQTAKMPDVRDRAKKLVELLCESEGNSEILKVRFTYDTAADRIAAEIKAEKHHAWEGCIFTDQAPEHEHVHIDDGVIREAIRRADSEIIKRCALGPPLWPLEQYKKWRSRNARSMPDRRAGKPVRKKQLRRAADMQNRKRKESTCSHTSITRIYSD